MSETRTITQIAKTYGVSTRTLRYYEEMGLITSTRVEGYAYRVYDSKACARLSQILILRKLRIPLKQIASLLSDNSLIGALGMFMQHIHDIDEEITTLSTIRGILQTFADRLRENPSICLNAEMLNDEQLFSVFSPLSLIKSNFREESRMADSQQLEKPFDEAATGNSQAEEIRTFEDVSKLMALDPILLLLGSNLIPLVDSSQGGDFLERVALIRRAIAMEKGTVIPIVRLKDDIKLDPAQYIISINGIEATRGEIVMGCYLAIIESENINSNEIDGIATVEPCFGKPAFWIADSQRKRAEELGCTVVEPAAVLATHLTETIQSHLHILLTLQDVQRLVGHVEEDNPVLIEELIPKYMSLNNVKKVLTRLLKDGASIRNMVTILETLLDYAPSTQDTDKLAEYVRQCLP